MAIVKGIKTTDIRHVGLLENFSYFHAVLWIIQATIHDIMKGIDSPVIQVVVILATVDFSIQNFRIEIEKVVAFHALERIVDVVAPYCKTVPWLLVFNAETTDSWHIRSVVNVVVTVSGITIGIPSYWHFNIKG